MQVILRKDFEALGRVGEVVTVKPGYARNYLIPQGVVYPATKSHLARLTEERRLAGRRDLKERRAAGDISAKLEGLRLIAAVQVGEEDRMFGAVTAQDIAELIKERGVDIDGRKIQLEEPIRHLGEYQVPIRLHRDVTVEVHLDVIKTN